jgi:hypothetical protein
MNEPTTMISSVMFAMPPATSNYTSVQIYGVSTEGSSSLTVTLHYSDSTMTNATFTIPDWFQPFAVQAPAFVVAQGLARWSSIGVDSQNGASLAGANITANSAKTLTSVTVTDNAGPHTSRFVLLAATAY